MDQTDQYPVETCFVEIVGVVNKGYFKVTGLKNTPFDGEFLRFTVWEENRMNGVTKGDTAKLWYRKDGRYIKFKRMVKVSGLVKCTKCGVMRDIEEYATCNMCIGMKKKALVIKKMRITTMEVKKYMYSNGIRMTLVEDNGDDDKDDNGDENVYYTVMFENHPDYDESYIKKGGVYEVEAVVTKVFFDEVTLNLLKFTPMSEADIVRTVKRCITDDETAQVAETQRTVKKARSTA